MVIIIYYFFFVILLTRTSPRRIHARVLCIKNKNKKQSYIFLFIYSTTSTEFEITNSCRGRSWPRRFTVVCTSVPVSTQVYLLTYFFIFRLSVMLIRSERFRSLAMMYMGHGTLRACFTWRHPISLIYRRKGFFFFAY